MGTEHPGEAHASAVPRGAGGGVAAEASLERWPPAEAGGAASPKGRALAEEAAGKVEAEKAWGEERAEGQPAWQVAQRPWEGLHTQHRGLPPENFGDMV